LNIGDKPVTESIEDEYDDMSDEEFLEELGKELKNSRECKEAWNAHDNFVNPGVLDESPELEGTDNAVKKCKPYKLVAHCEEENIDCEMKKPALEKPLLEDINNIFDLFESKDMPDDELPEEPVEEPAAEDIPEVPEEPEVEAPVEEPVDLDDKLIADLIKDEVEAIDCYKDAKETITDPESLETIEDIEAEEVDHIDRLADLVGKDPKVDELVEGLRNGEIDEFFRLCDELGIKNIDDLDHFAKEYPAGNILDSLRAYRAELGDDFNLPAEERGLYHGDLAEDTVVDDFPEPEGEPMSDKELEEAMGIKEPEEK